MYEFPVKNLTLLFAPATSMFYKMGIFALSDDVRGIYLIFCAKISCDLVTLTFDLLSLTVSDELSFIRPNHIPIFSILRLSVPELWVIQSDHITIIWNGHCACAVSRNLCIGVPKYHM